MPLSSFRFKKNVSRGSLVTSSNSHTSLALKIIEVHYKLEWIMREVVASVLPTTATVFSTGVCQITRTFRQSATRRPSCPSVHTSLLIPFDLGSLVASISPLSGGLSLLARAALRQARPPRLAQSQHNLPSTFLLFHAPLALFNLCALDHSHFRATTIQVDPIPVGARPRTSEACRPSTTTLTWATLVWSQEGQDERIPCTQLHLILYRRH